MSQSSKDILSCFKVLKKKELQKEELPSEQASKQNKTTPSPLAQGLDLPLTQIKTLPK